VDASGATGYGGCRACACGVHADWAPPRPPHHHLPAENVLLCVSWWLIENPLLAGALKVCRLKLPASSASNSAARIAGLSEQLIPTNIATSTIVLGTTAKTSVTGAQRCCALCGDASTKHWADDALTPEEASLSADRPGHVGSSKPPTASTVPARVSDASKALDKRPPVGKKREVRKDADVGRVSAFSTVPKPAAKDKRQKLVHPASEGVDRSALDVPDARSADCDYYFAAYDSDTQQSKETSRPELGEAVSDAATSGRDSVGSREDPADSDSASQLQRSQSVDALDDETSLLSLPASRARSGRESPADIIPTRSEAAVSGTSRGGGAELQQLRQELERTKAENRRLRIDTDLTMRKADRRFELEMEARRYWKREKSELEGVIGGLQRDQQRWMEEREKLRRVHGVIQSVMYTTSCTLESCLEGPSAQSSSAVARSSPATRLRSDLSAVSSGQVVESFASRGAAEASSVSGQGGGNTGTKRVQFFCIVCLEHTARVAIQPCGHICFCVVHAEEMLLRQHDHHYSKCPLCQVKIGGFLTLQGVDV
jgi:hypothetical protein